MQDGRHGLSSVIAGLEPGNPSSLQDPLAKRMDPRVKPAGDAALRHYNPGYMSYSPLRANSDLIVIPSHHPGCSKSLDFSVELSR